MGDVSDFDGPGTLPPRGASESGRPSSHEAEEAVRTLLRWAGDDPTREGLLDTPARVVRSYRDLFGGYDTDPRSYLERTFEEVGGYDQLVVLKDIRVVSCCEHHMLPVTGKAHVAYLPRDRVVGISKLSRVVNGFARRLQIQEKLTSEIAHAIQEVLNPHGVGVVIEAEHACMTLRGVNTPGSSLVTSTLLVSSVTTHAPAKSSCCSLIRRGRLALTILEIEKAWPPSKAGSVSAVRRQAARMSMAVECV